MNIRTRNLFKSFLGALLLIVMGAVAFNAQENNSGESNSQLRPGTELKDGGSTRKAVPAPAPSPSGHNWTGPYVGAHIGYGWGKGDTDFSPLPDAATFVNMAPKTLGLRPKGINGGIQAGYNWQFGHLVIGGETDFTWSDMRDTTTVTPIIQNNGTPFAGTGYQTTSQKTKWFGTLRPRLGVAFGRILVYGTAGLAYANMKNSANTDFRPFGTVQYPAFTSPTQKGWTAGGGVEIAFLKGRLSVKSEYLYYDVGRSNAVGNPTPALPPFQVGYSWETKAHTWNTGINFHF